MFTRNTLLALGLGIAMGAVSMPAMGQNESAVVAEIAAASHYRRVGAKAGRQVAPGKYKYYLAERDALEQFIDDQLLELQAKKEGVTLDELYKRHVAVNVPEPTEDQLRFYYEGVQTRNHTRRRGPISSRRASTAHEKSARRLHRRPARTIRSGR